ncbi:MAG: hypothetical protein AAF755_03155 [Pseudomonadota bacterium]
MNPDTLLTIGIITGMFAVPAIVSALTDLRRPYVGGSMLLSAVLLVVYASISKPEGYTFAELPEVMLTVIARILN